MAKEVYGYIYCTTDTTNGIKYIGQKKSNVFVASYFGSGHIIKRIVKKRPETLRVDLMEWCYNQDELNEREYDWTVAVGLYPLSYNLKHGGCKTGYSDELRKKLSELKTGEKNPNFGKSRSNKTREKIGNANRGKIHSEETRQKNSEARKGKKLSDEHKQKISVAMTGKIRSDEHSANLSKANTGKIRSDEYRANLSKANTGKRWFNNGIENKHCFECPNPDYVTGMLPKKRRKVA